MNEALWLFTIFDKDVRVPEVDNSRRSVHTSCAVVIFESSLSGHRARYVRYVADELIKRGRRPVLVLPCDALGSDEFREEIRPLEGSVTCEFEIPPHPSRGWRNMQMRWQALHLALIRHGPCIVVVPTADHLAQALWLSWFVWWRREVRSSEVRCLLLRLRPFKGGRLKDMISCLLLGLSPWRSFWSVDPRSIDDGGLISPRVTYLADPVPATSGVPMVDARKILGWPTDGPLLSMIGLLDERKGVDRLVHAWQRVAGSCGGKLVLMGEASPTVAVAVRAAQMRPELNGRIFWQEKRPTEEELDLGVSASDIVCVPYVNHDGLSSFVLKAAQARRWVLGCESGWIGETIRSRGLGWTADVASADALVDKIKTAVLTSRGIDVKYPNVDWISAHTPENFAAGLLAGVQ